MALSKATLPVSFPDRSVIDLDQDEEWFDFGRGDGTRRIRFHDYGKIYAVPGLYEHLFYDLLKCQSPAVVTDLLCEALAAAGVDPDGLRTLDLGAGNGMVGEALRERCLESIVGVDIVPEAGEAVERDRPGIYDDYHVCDLLEPGPAIAAQLGEFDVMTSVAALGFGDIPPEVFLRAFSLVKPGGWIAFTIKEDFLSDGDPSGFSALIARMLADGRLTETARRRYRHRLDVRGRPLHYVALVGTRTAA